MGWRPVRNIETPILQLDWGVLKMALMENGSQYIFKLISLEVEIHCVTVCTSSRQLYILVEHFKQMAALRLHACTATAQLEAELQ